MTSYTWSTGTHPNSPLTVSPTSTTTYTVNSTTAGCTGSASITIKVNPAPNLSINASPSTVCPGQTVNLTSNLSNTSTNSLENFEGATQSFTLVNGARNNWYFGNTFACNGSKSIYIGTSSTNNNYEIGNIFTPRAATNFAYKDYTITSYCNSELKFKWRCMGSPGNAELTVWAVPTSYTPVAGTAITASATEILLLGPLHSQATCQNATINLTSFAGQTVRIVFQWRNVGQNVFNTIPGPNNPAASIDDVELFESTTYAYSWTSNPTGFNASTQNATASPTVNTTYELQVTRCDGCSKTLSVPVNICTPLPVENLLLSLKNINNQFHLYWNKMENIRIVKYILKKSEQNGSFETLVEYEPSSEPLFVDNRVLHGKNYYYQITAIDENGFEYLSNVVTASLSNDEWIVYLQPNPASNTITVFQNNFQSEFELNIYNSIGQLIIQQNNLNKAETILDISNFSSGNYILQIISDKGIKTIKFVKQ